MQSLHTRYTSYHRKYHASTGHLFQGRFKAKLVNDERYLHEVLRYIHKNPKDLGVDPTKYRWSSLRHYRSQNNLSWMNKKIISKISEDKSYIEV